MNGKSSSKQNWTITEKVEGQEVLFRRSSHFQSRSKETLLQFNQQKPKLFKRRWFVLFLYNMAAVVTMIPYEVCVPIASSFTYIYGVSQFTVTMAATIYMLVHPLLSFICSQLIANRGWAYSTNLGVLFTIFGCALRVLINKLGFYIVILGQLFCGFGRPLIFNAQASMAMHWFLPESRIIIISILNLVHTLGMVLSVWIPGKMLGGYDIKVHPDVSEGERIIRNLMLIEFFISLGPLICILFMRSNPPIPPTNIKKTEIKAGFFKNLRILVRNKNFMFVAVPFSLFFGVLKALLVIIESLMKPFDFSQDDISFAASIPLVAGLISQASIPYMINKFQIQKKGTALLLLLATFSVGFLYFAFKLQYPLLVYACIAIMAMSVMPTIPILMDLGCDLVFPINASFAVGAMYMGSTFLMVIFAQFFSFIASEETVTRVAINMGIITSICFIGLIIFLFVKTNYAPVKVDIADSQSKMSFNYKGSSLSFYQNSSLFNCSFNVGLVGDTPTVNFEEDQIIEQEQEEENNDDYMIDQAHPVNNSEQD